METIQKTEQKKMNGCLKWFLIFMGAIFLIGLLNIVFTSKEDLAKFDKQTKIEDSLKNIEEIRSNLPYKCRNELSNLIKNNLKDPESYEQREITHFVNSDSTIIVNLTYAGKNSFNATIQETVIGKFDKNGNLIEIKK